MQPPRVTRQPHPDQAAYEAAKRRALVKNLLGLILLVAGAAGLGVLAWAVDPRLLYAAAATGVLAWGYTWATSEA